MRAVTPRASLAELEPWIRARLHPLDVYNPLTRRIDVPVDLEHEWPRPPGPFHPAAVLVPLVEREEGVNVILTRRSASLRRHSGQIAFPGGRADPGETPWDTALREAEEEIGLERRFVRVAGLGDLFETVTGYSITPVVGLVAPGFTLTPHEAEVAEVFESPFELLMNHDNHELRTRDFGDGRTRRYYAITHEEHEIWGVTAGILRSLSVRLFG